LLGNWAGKMIKPQLYAQVGKTKENAGKWWKSARNNVRTAGNGGRGFQVKPAPRVKDIAFSSEGAGVPEGVGNPVPIEGRGSTGRISPNTLNEQMAMHQVKSNPLKGASELPIKMSDARWPASEGWVKMQSVVKDSTGGKTTVHYVYNKITGAFDDFKFK
jgi:hypothetical protein